MNSAKFSVAILKQLAEVVNQLSNDSYCTTLDVFSGASIGQHTRHILEFYSCLLKQKDNGVVCYDARERNMELEQSVEKTLECINNLIIELETFENDASITLVSTLQNIEIETPSSLSREMLYALEHAVHHMAIIKIGLLLACPTLEIPANFGVADSTIQYRKQCAQ